MAGVMALRVVLATAAIVTVGALSPGPNNLIVLNRSAHRGFVSALPGIAAITSGSVALILIAASSIGVVLDAHHWLRSAIAVVGSAYLCWLGLGMVMKRASATAGAPWAWPDRMWSLFAFQFVNPKGWAIALTASTVLEGSRSMETALIDLVTLFAVIPAACLLLWSAAGASLARHLLHPRARLIFERSMGLMLLASAIAILL